MAGLFLGIDIGTGGVRACAVNSQGDIHGIASAALPPPRQDGDLIDQDPELWWQAAVTAILKLGQTVDLAGVERIAVDGTSGTLLLINAAGQPRSLGLMYNDARAAVESARIAEVAPTESGAHGRSSALAKLLHLVNGAMSMVHAMRFIKQTGSRAASGAATVSAMKTTH